MVGEKKLKEKNFVTSEDYMKQVLVSKNKRNFSGVQLCFFVYALFLAALL